MSRPSPQQNVSQWCRDELVLSFIFVQRLVSTRSAWQAVGQDAASKAHHCANTNVIYDGIKYSIQRGLYNDNWKWYREYMGESR